MSRTLAMPPAMPVMAALLLGCVAPTGPGPQEALFPPGQRVARGDEISVQLVRARYDETQVALQVMVSNHASTALTLEREGMLLAYEELEYPISTLISPALATQTVVDPSASATLELGFVLDQALVRAATLHLHSLRHGERSWAEPLELVVPPPAAFIDESSSEP